MKFWFVVDELIARINEIKRQRARGKTIDEAHVARLDEMASELREMAREYDAET